MKHPDDAAAFAADMEKIDPNWRTSRSNRWWASYLGISLSNFCNVRDGRNVYTPNRRALLEKFAQAEARSTEIQAELNYQRDRASILPDKLDDYILQQDTQGRYVLTRVVATFRDKQEAELFSGYVNKRTK